MPNNELIRLKYKTRMIADSEEAEIMLYGEICDDWWSVVTDHKYADRSAVDFDNALKAIKGAKKVTLRINSPGGFCNEAVAMRTMLINAGFESLTISIEGLCASAATLLACIPGATVKMSEGSEYMIHNPSGGEWGTAEVH
ncbi:MAG: ATP-dependent Clp protease proteolytic subunit, partial [Clostridia bacterium]